MLKKNKGLLIITSLVILLPMAAGLIFYDQLPETLISHWGIDGNADAQTDKALMVFLMPGILLAVHWLCIFMSLKDPKHHGNNEKLLRLVLWIMPVLSLVIGAMMYFVSSGTIENAVFMIPVLLGVLFLAIGNYMPKVQQSSTMGVRMKWTFSSKENWYATHRLTGKIWVLGGALMILTALLPSGAMAICGGVIIVVMIAVPAVYSWQFYRKQKKEGTLDTNTKSPYSKKAKMITIVAITLVLAGVAVLMLVGDVAIEYGEESFTVSATFWQPLTVSYEKIEEIEYRENWQPGMKRMGYDSIRLVLGGFQHDEIGLYTSYCYRQGGGCVLLRSGDDYLALSGPDAAATQAIYNALMEKVE